MEYSTSPKRGRLSASLPRAWRSARRALALSAFLLSGLCATPAAMAANASPVTYTEGDTVRTGGKYHIQNVATGLWLTEGDNWGTHASLDSVGCTLQTVASGTGFYVKTQFGSLHMNSASNGVWMDQSTQCTWYFTPVEGTDYYTISSTAAGTNQLQWTGSGTLVNELSAPTDATRAQWLLVLDSRMEDSLSAATYDNPRDATFLLKNPGFAVSYAGDEAWTGTEPTIGGYRVNTAGTAGGDWCASQSDKTFDTYQTLSGLPAGVWGVSMQGFNRAEDDEQSLNGLFYIGDNYAALPDIHSENSTPADQSGAATAFVAGKYKTGELRILTNSGKFTIGVKKETLLGQDWTAWDNVRLTYYGSGTSDMQALLKDKLAEAETLDAQPLTASVKSDLETAISKTDVTKTSKATLLLASMRLDKAVSAARLSAARYSKLQDEIAAAQALLDDGTGEGAAELAAAITTAQAAQNDTTATDDTIDAARLSLLAAETDYTFANATGDAPTVTTDTRFARGCTMAFGRMTVTGSNVKERGFCYATHPNPTYTDGHSTDYLDNNGRIYVMKNLTPATIYYIRAYAISSGNAIGYGDVLKVVTLPKANVNFSMRTSGDDASARIEAAAQTMCDIWNDLTSITGYNSSIGYASGTPTADCSYGGWMRVGPSTSYQAPGTILHEWLHGIGVGTHSIWTDSNMRSNGSSGYWLGERANEVLRFWDNDESSQLNGDGSHMWPYGCNGAHEDTGSNVLYYGGTLIAQALGEDGLPPTGGFASPAYVFDQEDSLTYYIKSESEACGLLTSYLTVDADGALKWQEVAADQLTDDYAWHVKFTPSNSYYQIQHVGTGRYITYDGSTFTTVARSSSTSSAENLHLMKGRVDVADAESVRGYWFVHPQSELNPPTMTAQSDGTVASSSFNIASSATTQRWVIATMEQTTEFSESLRTKALSSLDALIANYQKLRETAHTELAEGVDDDFDGVLSNVIAKKDAAADVTAVQELTDQLKTAACDFLNGVTASDADNPFDLTFMLENSDMSSADGWNGGTSPSINYGCAEFYQTTFDFYQTLTQLPSGTYRFMAQGFQRPGSTDDVYTAYQSGTSNVTAQLYAGSANVKLCNIFDDAQTTSLGGTEKQKGSLYVPNDMQAASKYFAKNLYENTLQFSTSERSNTLRLGLKGTESSSYYWTIFDNFRLYFYGGDATGISSLRTTDTLTGSEPQAIYDLSGRRLQRITQPGIYIVNGKKVRF